MDLFWICHVTTMSSAQAPAAWCALCTHSDALALSITGGSQNGSQDLRLWVSQAKDWNPDHALQDKSSDQVVRVAVCLTSQQNSPINPNFNLIWAESSMLTGYVFPCTPTATDQQLQPKAQPEKAPQGRPLQQQHSNVATPASQAPGQLRCRTPLLCLQRCSPLLCKPQA